MNKRTYAKFYEYGASAFGDIPQTDSIHRIRYQNFQNFLDKNPSIIPPSKTIHCQRHLRDCGSWRCYRSMKGCPEFNEKNSEIWDHGHDMRIKGVPKSHFVATHPYNTKVGEDYSPYILQGLEARLYDKSKSWYYPNSTYLFIISRPEVLEMVSQTSLGEPLQIFHGSLPD